MKIIEIENCTIEAIYRTQKIWGWKSYLISRKFWLAENCLNFHRLKDNVVLKNQVLNDFLSSISKNHISLQFYVVNSHLRPIHVISREMMLKFTSNSLEITKNGENCHSYISRFSQMVRSEITFTPDSRKFCSRPITPLNLWKVEGFPKSFLSLNKPNFLSQKRLISSLDGLLAFLFSYVRTPACSPPFCRQQKFGIFFGSRDAGVFLREIFPQSCIGRLWNEWDLSVSLPLHYYFCASSKVEENKILIFPWKRHMLFIQDSLLQQVFTCELFKTTSYTSVQL